MTLETDVTTLASSAIVPKAVALVTVKDMDKVLRFYPCSCECERQSEIPEGADKEHY